MTDALPDNTMTPELPQPSRLEKSCHRGGADEWIKGRGRFAFFNLCATTHPKKVKYK